MEPPSTTLPSQSSQRYQHKTKQQPRVNSEPAVKPKKVNSEIRKQQNRIASRNYREKRKRKLQYLQQLISDDTEDPQDKQHSPEQQDMYAPSQTPDHNIAGPSSSPYRTPSNSNLGPMSGGRKATYGLIAPATTGSFSGHHAATSHAYGVYPSNWSAHPYSPPPPPPSNTVWTIPSAWTLGFEHPAQSSQNSSMYQYSAEPSVPVGYEQTQNLSQQPHEYLSNAYLYSYTSPPGSQHQVTHNPNVSLPISAPGYQQYHPRPH